MTPKKKEHSNDLHALVIQPDQNGDSLTREPPQLIRADFAHILSIYRGHHAKKKPKRIWAHAVFFEGYGHFTDFSAYGKGVYVKIE